MKLPHIVMALIAAAAVGASGLVAYRLGLQRGQGLSVTSSAAGSASTTQGPTTALSDPTTWGIPEGEAATRRHVKDDLKAGAVDPLTDRKILYYHDPMVPGKKFDAPGKSPFMDMMLVPAYAGSEGADGSSVTVSSRIQQNLGLRTAIATEGVLTPEVSAVGAIAWNERDQATVQARAMGFVEKLHVRATLDRVHQGQPLLDLYVPDWVAAQEDFFSVRRMQSNDTDTLIAAARARMRQVGMDEAQIRLVEASGQTQARLTIRAPISGVVTELMAREGMTVMPGVTLARINGTATVWANAEVPESQLALLQRGARVLASSPALPGMNFEGRVQALLPEVNPQTRTLKARVEFSNAKERLVPGMFVQMVLAGTQTDKTVLVPTEAIIQTGKRTLVMLAEADGQFRPAEVETGIEVNGKTEIKRGVAVGQRVVLSGQFLIDSEANLKGIEARLNRDPEKAPEQAGLAEMHQTSAHIEAIQGEMLTLSHPAIASLKWPAMTMDFKLPNGSGPRGLAPGQDVEIAFRMQDDDAPQIVTIQRNAPGGTTGAAQ